MKFDSLISRPEKLSCLCDLDFHDECKSLSLQTIVVMILPFFLILPQALSFAWSRAESWVRPFSASAQSKSWAISCLGTNINMHAYHAKVAGQQKMTRSSWRIVTFFTICTCVLHYWGYILKDTYLSLYWMRLHTLEYNGYMQTP